MSSSHVSPDPHDIRQIIVGWWIRRQQQQLVTLFNFLSCTAFLQLESTEFKTGDGESYDAGGCLLEVFARMDEDKEDWCWYLKLGLFNP